jgi:predicted kinase
VLTPVLVIIAGPPASGKTTLGHRLASDFQLPFVHKDGLKALLFDILEPHQREPLYCLGLAGTHLLYYFAKALISAGHSGIVEACFDPTTATKEFEQLQQHHPFTPFQVQCYAQEHILLERFRARIDTGTRHASHPDQHITERFKDVLIQGRMEPLAIGGHLFALETTDFAKSDYAGLSQTLRQVLSGHPEPRRDGVAHQ